MSVSIQDVRIKAQDTTEPYTHSDADITNALADAADWIVTQDVPTSCPKYDLLHKFVAARSLKTSFGKPKPLSQTPISQITEGNHSVSYATETTNGIQYQLQQLNTDINDLVSYCKGKAAGKARGGIGVLYGNH